MLLKASVLIPLILAFLASIAGANTITLPGNYEKSASDIIVLNGALPDRTITYDVGVLQGNEINFVVRYGNLNALNTSFGDTVNTGGFRLYHSDNVISEVGDITQGIFDQRSVSVSDLVNNGSLQLRLALLDGSDPLTFYQPWLLITDDTPPAPTADLEVTQSFSNGLRLGWTASGDDGLTGNASLFEIRYSKWPVDIDTSEWWGYAEQATNAPDPDAPGSHMNFVVGNLDTVSTYYFILVTYDEVGNRSAFSNVATGTTGQGGPSPGANYCLDFNGRNSRCIIPNQEILNPRQSITVEAWCYSRENHGQTQHMILDKGFTSYQWPYYQYNIATADNSRAFNSVTINNNWYKLDTGSIPLNENEWTHLAFTYDGSQFVSYVNGQLNQQRNLSGLLSVYNTNINIGIRGAVDIGYFDGLIDEIRIWNIARTQEQIQQNMNHELDGNEEGLIGYWKFDEGEGQLISDGTDHGSNGYLGTQQEVDESDPQWVLSDAPLDGIQNGIGADASAELPESAKLSQNYPNPFNAETKINYVLPKDCNVRLEIFDMLGRTVATLANGNMTAGNHDIIWNGKTDSGEALSSGLYFYRLKTDNFDQTRKMMMLK